MRSGNSTAIALAVVSVALASMAHAPPALRPPPSPVPMGTVVSGDIVSNTSWTLGGSPYWIVADTYVFPGVSLRIEAGVEIRFELANLTVFGGQLEALGTSSEHVVLASNRTPAPSGWGLINAIFGGSLIMRNTTVEYGSLGSQNPGPFLLDRIAFNYLPGIIVYDGGSSFVLENSTINAPGGVEIRNAGRASVIKNVIAVPGSGTTGVDVFSSPGVVIQGNRIRGYSSCVQTIGTAPTILQNEVSNCVTGLLIQSSDALVADNRIYDSQVGVRLSDATRAVLRNNLVTNNTLWGLAGSRVQNADIFENAIIGNGVGAGGGWGGIYMWGSTSVLVHHNTIQENDRAIFLDGGQWHRIHNNWLIDNDVQGYDVSSSSLWDNGYPSGGNHWSDYTGDDLYRGSNQNLPGPDGIGDSPRPVPPNLAVDRYPYYSVPAPGIPMELTARTSGDDIQLRWKEAPMADEYFLYMSDASTTFDFASPVALGNVTSWTDVGAAGVTGERYYVLRAHNTTVNRTGPTGSTAAKWTHAFPAGGSTLSLPLCPYPWVDYTQPGWMDTASEFLAALGGTTFAYMEAGQWMSVPGAGDPDRPLRVGEGYFATVPPDARIVFTGVPGAMIDHAGWPPYPMTGFDPDTSAREITATAIGNDVRLEWTQLPGLGPNGTYEVHASTTPAGLRGYPGFDYRVLGRVPANASAVGSFVHDYALLESPEWYYLVVPIQDVYWRGSSTYSVGVFAVDLGPGFAALAMPLRPYANGSYVPVSVSTLLSDPALRGAVWYDTSRGDWVAHAMWMPVGMYDAAFEMIMAVQVAAAVPTRVVFAGV